MLNHGYLILGKIIDVWLYPVNILAFVVLWQLLLLRLVLRFGRLSLALLLLDVDYA